MSTASQTEIIIQRHLDAYARGDVPALLADYVDDCVFISAMTGVVKGRAGLEQLYVGLFRDVLPLQSTELSFGPILVSGEVGLVSWKARTPTLRTQGASDTFVVRNGKIVAHTGSGSFIPLDQA